MQFSFTSGLLTFDSNKRDIMHFDNYTFIFNHTSYFISIVYGLDNLITMELL